jgi:hypothetical protein
VVVVATIQRQPISTAICVFQTRKECAFARVATEVSFGFVVQVRAIARKG